ncbi:MAG: c-type cytochrome [Gemmatimonadaceae bacterium]
MPTIRRSAAITCAAILPLVLLAACGGGEKQPVADTGAAAQTAAAPAAAGGAQTGEQIYQRCMTCHQANGEGIPGTYPPLAGSEYATAENPAVPIRIVLYGLQGPVTVKGQQFNGVMPAYGTGIEMSDAEVASVLTYVRKSFGNSASEVTADQVAKERAAPRAQTGAATAQELDAMMKK